jgi:hypothetical protein
MPIEHQRPFWPAWRALSAACAALNPIVRANR